MQQLLDRFDFRIGPTTVAFVKSTNDDRLWCAHTMRFSSFRRLCVQQKTKIAWCVPGLTGMTPYKKDQPSLVDRWSSSVPTCIVSQLHVPGMEKFAIRKYSNLYICNEMNRMGVDLIERSE